MAYTVAVREKGKSGSWSYIGTDLRVYDVAHHSKPLTREYAALAKRELVAGALKLGCPIEARIVRLAGAA